MAEPSSVISGVEYCTRICNSCIVYLSNLSDMYTQAESVGVHIRQITRARDTTDMYHVG